MIRAGLLALLVACAAAAFRERALSPWVTRWTERVRRLPLPVFAVPARIYRVENGAALTASPARAVVLERIELGTASPVVALAERENVLYAGTFDDGLFRIESGEPRALAVDARVNNLALDADGTLIVATGGGAYAVSPAGEVSRFASGAFSAVAIWRGETWLASRRGLSVREKNGGLWTRGEAQGVAADLPGALADCGDALCIGASDGLWLFDGLRAERHSSASGELPADWVTAVRSSAPGAVARDPDRSRTIWAGTFDGGLARLGASGAQLISEGLPNLHIAPHALALRDGNVWAGTPRGLVVVEGADSRGEGAHSATRVLDLPLGRAMTAVIPAARGGVWAGGAGFLQRLEVSP